MKIQITIDVAPEKTKYRNADRLMDNIVNFARDLIEIGACEQELEVFLKEVVYYN